MQKNTSLRTVQKHRRISSFLSLCFQLSPLPRLMLETFIRSQFGRRYYSMRLALKIFFFLLLFPLFLWFPLIRYLLWGLWPEPNFDANTLSNFWSHYTTWYVFTFAFIVLAIRKKRKAMKNWGPTSCPGVSSPFFYKIKLFGRPLTARFIETIAEPLVTFLIGFILFRLEQKIGHVIMISSVFFSLSYIYAYRIADEKLMDIQDDMQSGDAYREVLSDTRRPLTPPDAEDVF